MKKKPAQWYSTFARVNGVPALLTWNQQELVNLLTFDIADNQITALRTIVNPDKLRFIARQWQQANSRLT